MKNRRQAPRKKKAIKIAAIACFVIGFIFLVVGISLLAKAKGLKNCKDSEKYKEQRLRSQCQYSAEAVRIGLQDMLNRIEETFYELYPNKVAFKSGLTVQYYRDHYRVFNPDPAHIKKATDASLALLKELNNKTIKIHLLKIREQKALAQLKLFLSHVFGQPYQANYYTGDFMLGIDLFCWQGFCELPTEIYNTLLILKPNDTGDLLRLKEILQMYNASISRYQENVKLGVRTGMVRSQVQCRAGIETAKRIFPTVGLKNESAILEDNTFIPIQDPLYYEDLLNKTQSWEQWKRDHGKPMNESLQEWVVQLIGKPFKQFLSYLESEHSRHCVPDNVSSGMGRLPVDYVYIDGKPDLSQPTTRTLPFGEKLLGNNSYRTIMSFFTTTDVTPEEVFDLGWEQLHILYPQALEIARSITGINDTHDAVTAFKKRLVEPDMFFGHVPANESNEEAYKKCSTAENAKKFCPRRWEAMQRWFNQARQVMSMLDPKTNTMFYFTGDRHTTPNCPVELALDFNPSSGAQSYSEADYLCRQNARYKIPFFMDRPGPKYEEWTTNAHEARPGHHTQVQGSVENFRDMCRDEVSRLEQSIYSTAFTEGWALYAENPLIAEETDTYKDPEAAIYKYGMLKMQIWRALRLIVDTGLHYYGYSRTWALKLFADYAWDTSDGAEKEVTRYQSNPGQATAYMIGRLLIMQMRNYSEHELGFYFDLREFHYHALAQGSSPLAFVKTFLEKTVSCTKNPSEPGCDEVMRVKEKDDSRHAKSWLQEGERAVLGKYVWPRRYKRPSYK